MIRIDEDYSHSIASISSIRTTGKNDEESGSTGLL